MLSGRGPRRQPIAAATPKERAAWLVAAADALDARRRAGAAGGPGEPPRGDPRLKGELARTTFQLRLFAGVLGEGSYLGATVDHADEDWGMGRPTGHPPR